MKIEKVTLTQLKDLLNDNDYWRQQTLPISKQRALSFIHNPRAEPDDPVLFCGYDNDELIGYLGVLPDMIFTNSTSYRIGLLSGWWVHKDYRKSGIGAFLFVKANQEYKDRLCGIKYNRKSGAVILRSGKLIELKKNAIQAADIYLRTNKLGNERMRKYKAYRVIRKPWNIIINGNCALKRRSWVKKNRRASLKIEYCNIIDNETDKFIKSKQQNSLFKRSAPEFNWIIQYPWVLQSPGLMSKPSNYFFVSMAKRFFHLAVKILDGDAVIGFLMMRVHDDLLDISYVYYDRQYESDIIGIIMLHAVSLNASEVKIYGQRLYEGFIRAEVPFLKSITYKNNVAVPVKFMHIDDRSYDIQGGDGDCVFA